MQTDSSNRLPVLAAEIRARHAGVESAARSAAEHAIAAGQALIEAKKLVGHGGWLPWVKEHCRLSARTASLCMRIVKLGLKSETVADLGIKAAGQVIAEMEYEPFGACADPEVREWGIFALYVSEMDRASPEQVMLHVHWILRRDFVRVEDWLGDGGALCRQQNNIHPSGEFIAGWPAFLATVSAMSDDEITARVNAAEEAFEARGGDKRPHRRTRRHGARRDARCADD